MAARFSFGKRWVVGVSCEDAARSLDGGLSEVRCAAFIKQLLWAAR